MGGKKAGDRFVEYDATAHRLWILGQRCHHGATGSIVAERVLGLPKAR